MPTSEVGNVCSMAAQITQGLILKGVPYDPPGPIATAALNIALKIMNKYQPPGPPIGTATFLQEDNTTQGTWKDVYGSTGLGINSDALSFPSYAQVIFAGAQNFIWENPSVNVRALQKVAGQDRIAATWYAADSFTAELIFSDALTHKVALYFLDWDGFGPRIVTVVIDDADGNHLDTRSLSQFQGGKYLQWSISGHVILTINNQMQGANAVMAGIFFD